MTFLVIVIITSKDENEKFYLSKDPDMHKIVTQKQKTAAWFVSHCDVDSKRNDLARKLQQYIDVEVYGSCGNLSCQHDDPRCNEMLNTTYKFYFSFENTLCADYVTEKLFDVMKSLVIPVVFSGADLSRFIPPKSYVNANDFKSPFELANFLKILSRNSREYVKYFSWKKYYRVDDNSDTANVCAICQKLNEFNFNTKKQFYENIQDWFMDSCSKSKIKF
jgi:alpha-1,3-fucosyltransferase